MMGVITVCDIDYGQIYGPFPANLTSVDVTYIIGMLTTDETPHGPVLQVDPTVHNGGARALDWLPYIKPARNEEEQNIEAYMKTGQVFYRTLRIIKAGEELLVWYSKDFCQLIDIPDVKRKPMEDQGHYVCTYCGETFENIFPLRAHMRFKCDVNGNQQKALISSVNDVIIPSKSLRVDSLSYKNTKYSDESEKNVSRKRPINDKDAVINKVFVSDGISPGSFKDYQNKDHNSNVKSFSPNQTLENISAFRKVEKSHSPQGNTASDLRLSPKSKNTNEGSVSGYISVIPTYDKQREGMTSLMVPPVVNNNQLMMANSSRSAGTFIDQQTRVTLMEAYRNSFTHPYNRLQESMLRKIEGLATNPTKHFIYADSVNSSVPYMKCANPIVDKIVCNNTNPTLINSPATAMNLSQNWCAKCNATFRMTSDLVYHMRSHHKREFDPAKRKRDEKLRCDICNETFKERHHLTRHMTSHA